MSRRASLLFLALAVIFFWRLWPEPDGFLYRPNSLYSDLTITHWPNALFIRHSLATWGQVPLWRPLILGGEPFAANPLSGLWYPPNLLLLLLPLTPAFNLLFVLHTAWAGWGGYRLASAQGASPAGAMLTALALMFAPKAVAHLAAGHVGLYLAFSWLPWVLWSVRRLAQHGGPHQVAGAAATLGMLVLADIRLGFYGGLAAAAYWLWTWATEEGRLYSPGGPCCLPGRARRIATAVAAALLAVALVAVQALPLALSAGRLNRGGLSLAESGIASLPPTYLAGLFLADHGGFQEWMTYLGAVVLLLALIGLARGRSPERGWWGILALLAVVYSMGTYTPFYGLLYRALPLLGWLRGPARAWFLVVLSAGLLAAQGLTALEEQATAEDDRPSRRRRLPQAVVALVGAALAGAVGGLALRLPANAVVAAVVWPAAGALVVLKAAAGRRDKGLFTVLILALALADLWGVGFTLYRVRPAREVLAEGEPAAAWLAAQSRPFRVYSPSYSLPQQSGARYSIEAVDGVDPFQLADYAAFMRVATGVNLPGYSVTIPAFPQVAEGQDMLLAHQGVVPERRMLGLLNVRFLAAAYPIEAEGLMLLGQMGGVYLYRNEDVLPRAFVVGRVEPVAGLEQALEWLSANDPLQEAVVEGGTPLAATEGNGVARLVEWTPNRITVEAEGPGLLVLSEVYDPDWRAEVDGQRRDIVRTDGILRGVYLEAGPHRVVFAYRPAGLVEGAWATVAGWACLTALCLFRRRRG